MKKTTFSIGNAGFIILLLAVLVLINLISINWFSRLDLTEGHIFTLSDASIETVKKLPDRLTVKCYFSKDLPSPYSSNARYLKDQLEEYRARSGGNFHFEFVDPADEKDLEAQANSFQIAPVQVNVVEADKIELKKVYMGMVFLYQDKSETIPLVQTTTGLEYEITSTIKRITADRIPKLGFLQGHGEADLAGEMTGLSSALQKNYEIMPVDLSDGKMVPEDLDALLIIRPTSAFEEWDLFALDQYIMRGGKVGLLAGQISTNLQEAQAVKRALNLDEFTANLGFRINSDLVVDSQCGMINIQQRQGFFTIQNALPYPFFPSIRKFDSENSMVRDLEEINLFFPSSIDTSIAAKDSTKKYTLRALAWSSEKSDRQANRWEINPTRPNFQNMKFTASGIPVAATVTGSFQSFFTGKERPGPREGEVYEGDYITVSPETRLVVVGEGNFATDAYLSSRANADFFLNLVDWLAQDESLIQIRTREITARPLAEISDPMKKVVKYTNILIPAVIFVLIGVVRWQMRRKYKPEL